jgi:hypothetical protein
MTLEGRNMVKVRLKLKFALEQATKAPEVE